jgi:hypothetical protein
MKKPILLVLFFFFILISCGKSKKERIKDAKDVVSQFVSATTFENEKLIYELYPSFRGVRQYWKLNDFKLTSATINKDESISIVGKANKRDLYFELEEQDDSYIIKSSKGMSTDYESFLYKFCKRIGCIKGTSTDVSISTACKDKEFEYKKLIRDIQTNIEENVYLENHSVTKNYGMANGDITMKNHSRFSVPGMSYKIEIDFLDNNNNVKYTSNERINVYPIQYGQTATFFVNELNARSFSKIRPRLIITDNSFIEQIIAENAEGANCYYNNNL